MILWRSQCDRHRAALVDFIDHGERGAATPAALDHLSTCRRCERELADLALTIVALRRTAAGLRLVPVPAPTRQRIAALAVARRTDPWRWRLQLGSLIASAAIAALVVAPAVGLLPTTGLAPTVVDAPVHAGAGVSRLDAPPQSRSPWGAEEARLAALPDVPSISNARGTLPLRYPDGRIRPWKEVLPTDTTAREWAPS